MKSLTSLMLLATVTVALGAGETYWSFAYQIERWFDFDNTTDIIYLGSSRLEGDTGYILGTSAAPFSTGLVLHPTKVPASDGFQLEFLWGQSNCSPRNASLPAYGGDGFAIVFLKDLPTNEQVQSSVGTMGVGRIPNAYVFGYSSTYNEFYTCHWNEPLPVVQTPGILRSRCRVFPFRRVLACGVQEPYFTFRSYYDYLEIWDERSVFLTKIPFQMDRGQYYLGFGFGNDNYYRKQELLAYSYYYRDQITRFNLSEANPQLVEIGTCGSSLINRNISFPYGPGTYGTAYMTNIVYLKNGFVSRFSWTPFDCDEFGIGGEGFAFFFSKSDLSVCPDYPGALGIEPYPNMTFVGYSALNDKFYVCQWNQTIGSFYGTNSACVSVANPLPRLTC